MRVCFRLARVRTPNLGAHPLHRSDREREGERERVRERERKREKEREREREM